MIDSDERITEPLVRAAASSRRRAGTRRSRPRPTGLRAAGERTAAIVGGSASNEEGYLVQRIVREALGSPHVDLARRRERRPRALRRALARPSSRASDLRPRPRRVDPGPRHRPAARDADPRPADPQGRAPQRRPAGRRHRAPDRPRRRRRGDRSLRARATRRVPRALAAELGDEPARRASRRRRRADRRRAAPGTTRDRLGERIGRGRTARRRSARCSTCAEALDAGARAPACSRSPPAPTAAACARSAACPAPGPGFAEAAARPRRRRDHATPSPTGEPRRGVPGQRRPGPRASRRPGLGRGAAQGAASCSRSRCSRTPRPRHADVVFPAESYAEKEGTVTHPDGRLQRAAPRRPAPGRGAPEWQVLVELSAALGDETGIDSAPRGARRRSPRRSPSTPASPHDEIGGTGVRWQERDAADELPAGVRAAAPARLKRRRSRRRRTRSRRTPASGSGTYRDLWAGGGHRAQPGAALPGAEQTLELAPARRRAARRRRRRRGRRALQRDHASGRGSRSASGCGPGRAS